MSERGGGGGVATGRHARVSPSPGKGSKIAYTPLPSSDPYEMKMQRNCLAIPMSSIQTGSGGPTLKSSSHNATTTPAGGGGAGGVGGASTGCLAVGTLSNPKLNTKGKSFLVCIYCVSMVFGNNIVRPAPGPGPHFLF